MKQLSDYLYYEEKNPDLTIYCGDCLEILPLLPKVDLVVTDPPYGIGFSEYDGYKDKPELYQNLMSELILNSEPLLKNGWMCVFQAAKKCREWNILFPRDWRIISFPKTFVQIFKVTGPTWATDYALLWPIGKPTQRGKLRDWLVSDTANMRFNRGHPCARPIQQMRHCVDMLSEKSNMVLDPFLGSGTTLVACKELGRNGIGIEISEKYCEIAKKRLQNTTKDMFHVNPVNAVPDTGLFDNIGDKSV